MHNEDSCNSMPTVKDLIAAVYGCEMERQTAQLSGLTTGWEYPCTIGMWSRVLKLAEILDNHTSLDAKNTHHCFREK